MATRSSTPVREISFLLLTTIWLVGNRGCDPDLASQCRGDFAGLTAEIAEFRQEGVQRTLASGDGTRLTEDEQERCARWARKRLIEVQELLDVTMREPGLRAAAIDLNQIATDFVMLHGACDKGDRTAMQRELASLEQALPKAEAKACWPTQASLEQPHRVNP